MSKLLLNACGALLLYKSEMDKKFSSVDIHICESCRLYIARSCYVLSRQSHTQHSYIGRTALKFKSQYTILHPPSHADASSDESHEKK